MSDSPTIPYGKQTINEDDIQAVVETLKSDFWTQGPKVKEFESKFGDYVGAKYAVAVTNGTAALHLSTLVLGVKPGSKVITTPMTFAASANCVLYCGGDVEFADIDPKTYCLDPNKVEDLLKRSPKAYRGIIPMDYAGYPANMSEFRTLADKYDLWIIEDACHAPGASFKDKKEVTHRAGDGSLADLTVFSFHPVKHLGCGEGGMVTTNDEKLYQKLLLLRTHGITKDPAQMTKYDGGWYHEMQELGYNFRISDILCALGVSQMDRIDASFQRRQEIANRYQRELSSLPITIPYTEKDFVHAYHLYVIRTQERKKLYEHLKKNNIQAQVHYLPVYDHPYYIKRYGSQKLEHTDNFYQECLSIPMYHSLTEDEQTRVIHVIKSFFS